ncbi:hypothetical protein R3I93_019938 [Phoxinus phoxinus]|uniref:Uncharacterized protein n=1 Tax=Phoxinus phoxinus TaxID=58324 RepID=A0AAN9GUR2_9TELE
MTSQCCAALLHLAEERTNTQENSW